MKSVISDAANGILSHLREVRKLDFSAYHHDFVAAQIRTRMEATGAAGHRRYLALLKRSDGETDRLLDRLLINFSLFFRKPLEYEFLSDVILPRLACEKNARRDAALRIWSAGCASGEEPYSIAITVREWVEQTESDLDVRIFATDIHEKALETARRAVYSEENLRNVKYGLLRRHFTRHGDAYRLSPDIRQMVSFSAHDLLSKTSYTPPESIFGNFDLVFCRNVLMYLGLDARKRTFAKLWRGLADNGVLVTGGADDIPPDRAQKLTPVCEGLKMYRKQEAAC